jgi:hypothetical protein
MNKYSIKYGWLGRARDTGVLHCGCVLIAMSLSFFILPRPAYAGEKPVAAGQQSKTLPATVQARYRLRYNGIDVGRVVFNFNADGSSYSLSGSGKVSVLFGAYTWSGSSSASGVMENGKPAPASYAFNWRNNKKSGETRMSFKDRAASEVMFKPAKRTHADAGDVTLAHKTGALDPMSAILELTKADHRQPCDRRVGIFDGTQRYDIVFTPKRQERLPSRSGGGKEIGYVCRATYDPIIGHRMNADTKSFASNRDIEVVMRRVPNSEMLIPYSVTVPTAWGTGVMVSERVDFVTASAGKSAVKD